MKKTIKAFAVLKDGKLFIDAKSKNASVYVTAKSPNIGKIAAMFNLQVIPCTITYEI